MKLVQAIQELGEQRTLDIAENYCPALGLTWNNGIRFVFNAVVSDSERVPGNISGNTPENTILKWLEKYKGGYSHRASKRTSNPPGTVADPIIDRIVSARLDHLTSADLYKISYAHRLGMSAENILGLLLEEYLAIRLAPHSWHCAWGETVKSVDFVHERGRLLQIKNRSNSENSSSSAIRNGTEIEKWYRIRADRLEYMWQSLNQICETTHLSEDDFVSFTMECIGSNPSCLAVEMQNPWRTA